MGSFNRTPDTDRALDLFAKTALAEEMANSVNGFFNLWVAEVAKFHAVKTGTESPVPRFFHLMLSLCLELPPLNNQLLLAHAYRSICKQLSLLVVDEWRERYVLSQSHQFFDCESIRTVKEYLTENGERFDELFETYHYVEQAIGGVEAGADKTGGGNIVPITSHANSLFVKKHEFKQLFMEYLEVDLERASEEVSAIRKKVDRHL